MLGRNRGAHGLGHVFAHQKINHRFAGNMFHHNPQAGEIPDQLAQHRNKFLLGFSFRRARQFAVDGQDKSKSSHFLKNRIQSLKVLDPVFRAGRHAFRIKLAGHGITRHQADRFHFCLRRNLKSHQRVKISFTDAVGLHRPDNLAAVFPDMLGRGRARRFQIRHGDRPGKTARRGRQNRG